MSQPITLSSMTWEDDNRSYFFMRREAADEELTETQLEIEALKLGLQPPVGEA